MDFLNFQFEHLLQSKISSFVTYCDMVEKNPYQVLLDYSYDAEERPLSVPDVPVSLPSPFSEVSNIREHSEFIQMLINASINVQMNQSPSLVNWRGYSTKIGLDFILSKENVKSELINALSNLQNTTQAEKQVKCCGWHAEL